MVAVKTLGGRSRWRWKAAPMGVEVGGRRLNLIPFHHRLASSLDITHPLLDVAARYLTTFMVSGL